VFRFEHVLLYQHKIYNYLCTVFDKQGNIKVPNDHKWGGKNVSDWIYRQRRDRDKLSKEKIELLDKINFDWKLS